MYGISNCDTIKKARNWMEKNGINYVFHDYKVSGITKDKLEEWVMQVGWEPLLNKRGTTFKKLPDMVKENVNEDSAIMLMQENPSMIKRPVLEHGDELVVGFKASDYETAGLTARNG
ncbi:ArsC family reductase [Parasphingorhabdus sp. JC815]|uniref:ArsC family reductase n=1 Tax=Parasphingorhabdus sp. JC815 TaxID=3232140 RepID=UPI003457F2E5